MKKPNLGSFVLFACISVCLINSLSACDKGWFGSECQYKCRCRQSCNLEGECPDKCENGWFGYKCQYRLHPYTAVIYKPNYYVTTILNDDNENTCITFEADGLIIILNELYYNPWIRLSTLKPENVHSTLRYLIQMLNVKEIIRRKLRAQSP
uniref:EGF-like domain-containing protein n=1 Tax=Biomphalaria glabrata TaxID=6526 RepID=A0A2C9KFG6_BIOGL